MNGSSPPYLNLDLFAHSGIIGFDRFDRVVEFMRTGCACRRR